MQGKNQKMDSVSVTSEGVSRRGETVYYIGTLLFVSGVILLALGGVFVIMFKIHYGSSAKLILQTFTLLSVGLLLVFMGINLMIKQKKKGYFVFGIGSLLSMLAIALFILNYVNNWYYPLVSYVLTLFLMGFLLLIGNAFGNVTVWLIENKMPAAVVSHLETGSVKREYTDEEIQRDIEEAMKKSINAAADRLSFEFDDSETLKISRYFDKPHEKVVKVKDDMRETDLLQQAINPGVKDQWGSIGIEKASMQLAQTLNQQKTTQKHASTFGRIFSRFRRHGY